MIVSEDRDLIFIIF